MIKRIALIASLSAFILSCSTTYSVRLLKPAEVNLAPIKKVAVMDFRFKGGWDNKKKPNTIPGVAVEILKKHLGIKHKLHYPGKAVSGRLITDLVQNGHYTVVERNQLQKVMAEQQLSLSGAVDENQAVQIGKLAGVEALILGSGGYTIKDIGKWEEKKIKDENDQERKVKVYKAIRKVDLQLTYRIVNVTTGEIMASRNLTWANYTESGSKARYSDFAVDSIKANAIRNIPAWRPIVDRLVGRTTAQIVKQIAPHYVVRRKKIENGKTPGMKAAIKYVKRNMWDDAKQSWEMVLQDRSEKAAKDHVSARYNLGIYYEINDDLDKAEQLFDQCFKQSGKDKYLNAKANVQRRRIELQKLEEQINE